MGIEAEEIYPGCRRAQLENGLTILVEERDRRPLSLGLWVRVGGRDESPAQKGIAHFLEHLLFKGTEKRTAFQIAEEIDALGGAINGVTHKEYTLYYVDVLAEHLEEAFDVLADLVQHPLLKPEDIEKERLVVLEEIRMTEDDPQERVFDLFNRNIWEGEHPLAWPILGTADSVRCLKRKDLVEYFKLYHPVNFILVAAGGIHFEELLRLAKAKLEDVEENLVPRPRHPPRLRPHFHVEHRELQQAHLCLGGTGLPRADERRYALEVMNAIFGSGMSSNLFKRIREELALAYEVFSGVSYYSDSGLFYVYLGTEPGRAAQAVEAVLEEIEKMKEPVTPERLRLAKEKLKGNLLLGLEGSHARMVRLGLGELYDLHLPVEEVIDRIEAVTVEQVQEIAGEIFSRRLSLTAVGPEDQLQSLKRVFD